MHSWCLLVHSVLEIRKDTAKLPLRPETPASGEPLRCWQLLRGIPPKVIQLDFAAHQLVAAAAPCVP